MSWGPTKVNSREELERLLRACPMRLRPARKSNGPRVGHPSFIGPIDPSFVARPGAIRFEEDGSAYFELSKGPRKLTAESYSEAIGGGFERR